MATQQLALLELDTSTSRLRLDAATRQLGQENVRRAKLILESGASTSTSLGKGFQSIASM